MGRGYVFLKKAKDSASLPLGFVLRCTIEDKIGDYKGSKNFEDSRVCPGIPLVF